MEFRCVLFRSKMRLRNSRTASAAQCWDAEITLACFLALYKRSLKNLAEWCGKQRLPKKTNYINWCGIYSCGMRGLKILLVCIFLALALSGAHANHLLGGVSADRKSVV